MSSSRRLCRLLLVVVTPKRRPMPAMKIEIRTTTSLGAEPKPVRPMANRT
jgi:hypothetical protein